RPAPAAAAVRRAAGRAVDHRRLRRGLEPAPRRRAPVGARPRSRVPRGARRSHVRARLVALLDEYVTGFRPDPNALEEKLEAFDPMHPESIQQVMGDPEALLGAVQTDAQRDLLVRIKALTAALFGYVDHV